MKQLKISRPVMERLPVYLHYLKSLTSKPEYISSTVIARSLRLGEVQVRKDLGIVSGAGKPKIGYDTVELIRSLEDFLGYNSTLHAVIVGAGKLGTALYDYEGFREYGVNIMAAFDANPAKCGVTPSGRPILPMDELAVFCRENHVEIGIITVPDSHAQEVCDRMVEAGISAIWNFAMHQPHAPAHVRVQNENLASSLALLCGSLRQQLE